MEEGCLGGERWAVAGILEFLKAAKPYMTTTLQ